MKPKTFKIVFTETITHHFYVEAEDEDEALEEFNYMGKEGKLDFSDGEVTDSTVTVEPEEDQTR